MKIGKSIAASAAIACAAAALLAAHARAGGDKVMFPENHASGVLYTTVDRADNKQFRELYVSPPAAIEAARKGEPMPSGTVITLVQYAALPDVHGNPQIGLNGRFIKGNRVGYTVMEKRTGWAPNIRTTCATASGSIRPSRRTRRPTRRPTSPPASIVTSRWEPGRTTCSATTG